MASFLKKVSILGLVSGGYAAFPYGKIQARGTLVPAPNIRIDPSRNAADTVEGCNLWFRTYEGDTCDTVIKTSEISLEDLINWNPSLEDGNCDDLIQPDTDYCVSIEPPREVDPPAKPTPSRPTPQPEPDNSISTPAPVRPGMTKSCTNFHYVQPGQGCVDILPMYPELSQELLYEWNPSIGAKCNMMWAGTYICVGTSDGPTRNPAATPIQNPGKPTPSPIGAGTTRDCQRWAYARTDDNCYTILSRNKDIDVTIEDLYRWNPTINPDCSGLVERSYICILGPKAPRRPTTTTIKTTTTAPSVKTPSPIALAGTTKNCMKWAFVRSGDDCGTILDRNPGVKSTIQDLFNWNRSIRSDCSALVEGNYICILAPESQFVNKPAPATTMMTTTRTVRRTTTVRRTSTVFANPVSTPSPVQAGTVDGCMQWAYVKEGQTCNDIVNRFDWLSLEMLVRWNPAIGSTCWGLWARTYVCVRA
ncbi:hypothetical protein TWF481_001982 [Arthrobotrys musiformis]|uniref:LysM domain-containing protein n=1 Tax=Arthrobotrys musiformis TaxID=47236 RepID=A0AAV9VV23_9PEZI